MPTIAGRNTAAYRVKQHAGIADDVFGSTHPVSMPMRAAAVTSASNFVASFIHPDKI